MKKLFSWLLIVVLVLCSTGTVTAQEDGILFERWSYYRSEKVLEKLPGTFEATVNLSEFTNTDQPSVILGSSISISAKVARNLGIMVVIITIKTITITARTTMG